MIPDKVFYVDPNQVRNNLFSLNKSESNHLINVLRLRTNDQILIIDGMGCAYVSLIKNISNKNVSGEIQKKYKYLGENQYNINIAPGLIKRNRFENMIEKAVELGVKEIQPLLLDHCHVKHMNFDRVKKIIVSSSKQCKRSFFPILNNPIPLKEYLKSKSSLIIAGSQKSEVHLKETISQIYEDICLIIGPEGDFSDDEYKLLESQNILLYSLGSRRLRSETACIASISILNELFND